MPDFSLAKVNFSQHLAQTYNRHEKKILGSGTALVLLAPVAIAERAGLNLRNIAATEIMTGLGAVVSGLVVGICTNDARKVSPKKYALGAVLTGLSLSGVMMLGAQNQQKTQETKATLSAKVETQMLGKAGTLSLGETFTPVRPMPAHGQLLLHRPP